MSESLGFTIEWQQLAPDDYMAKFNWRGGWVVVFRIEQMDVESWWGSISVNGETVWDNNGEWQPTLEKCKKQIVSTYKEISK